MPYESVIGFEVHAELATQSKIFCGCSTRFGNPPNTQTCPVCLGLPGALPVLNKRAVELALRAAVALNCTVNSPVRFERKNYYYPDLPKNYQISQLRRNLGVGGWLDVRVGDETKRVRINNVHLEEDAGKIVHPEHPGANYSLIDLNRTGTPLLEIVSEPDLRGAAEADAYMHALKSLLEYIEVSDCNMHEGRLRFEVNMSMRPPGETALPSYRAEIKNLGSMKSAVRCIEYEAKRQSRALEKGEPLAFDTRLWDDAEQKTRSMRSKESASDYRYFPEPDLVEVEIDDAWLSRIRAELPELPAARKARFVEQYGLPDYDAEILTASRAMAEYYETAVRAHNNPKALSNWVMTELLRELNDRGVEANESPIPPERLAELVQLVDEGRISGKAAKDVFAELLAVGRQLQTSGIGEQRPLSSDLRLSPTATTATAIVQKIGLEQVSDASQVETWVDQVIAANPGPAKDFAEGKDKALGFLVGQVMRLSKSKADPQIANDLLRRKLRS